jgi:DNA-directed RNA polymerase subunit RPC12/RpoP
MKTCASCKISKPSEEYFKDKAKTTRLTSYCKECSAKKRKTWRQLNTDHVNEQNRLRRRTSNSNKKAQLKFRWKKLGIELTHDILIEQFELQNYACAICKDEINLNYYHYDHDHSTNTLREILCPPCNKGIGHMSDDPYLLRQAAKYIEKHSNANQI